MAEPLDLEALRRLKAEHDNEPDFTRGLPRRIKARAFHLCDGTVGARHRIGPNESYERRVFHDDEHGTFQTFRICDWCASGATRIEATA